MTLSVLGALGAALTVGLHRGGVAVGLLILPLTGPLLISARERRTWRQRRDTAGTLVLACALPALAATLGPLAIAAALRVVWSEHELRHATVHVMVPSPRLAAATSIGWPDSSPWLGCDRLLADRRRRCMAALRVAPPDSEQGEGYRIIYVHVPSGVCRMWPTW